MKTLLAFLTLISLGCYQPVAPDYPYERLKPPRWYRHAYEEVVKCADSLAYEKVYIGNDIVERRKVKFDDILFFVSDVDSFTVKGIRTVAMATGWDIYLTRPVIDSLRIVKHEMMHVATQIFAHPVNPFYRCRLMWGQ